MATATQKKKAPAKTKTATGSSGKRRPVRREVWSLVCFFVGLFTVIGYFNIDAIFITYFCGFLKCLLGYGYYILPVTVFVCGLILAFHRGRPVKLRCICTLCTSLAFGALCHLIFCQLSLPSKPTELLPALYESGAKMQSGGLICGGLGIMFRRLFSVYGAIPVFFIALVALVMVVVKVTPSMMMERIKNRERLEYEPEPEPVASAGGHGGRAAAPAVGGTDITREKKHRSIDISTAEGPAGEYKEKKVGFFNTNPRVPTPEQLVLQHMADDASGNKEASVIEREKKETPAAVPAVPGKEKATESVPVVPAHAPHAAPVPTYCQTEAVKPNPTAAVAPLSMEEAANMAGVKLSSPEDLIQSEGFSSAEVREMRSAAKKTIAAEELRSATDEVTKAVEEKNAVIAPVYHYPPASLLHEGSAGIVDGSGEVAQNSARLQETLDSFGVMASICATTRGPTVTRYDLKLSSGVKLSKLTNLAGDLALALGVSGVRIAPIPDKESTVGIEVPNKIVSTVYLRDIVDTDTFRGASSRLTFALGKDIGGNAVVGNIAKLPHLLIAGTTGSGKSVCMNSLILSLLFKATPEEVRLIMIDPKMVELGIYNGIPHLYVPVVTDAKKAAGSLQWSVIEMLKRYRLFSEAGVRDLTGYNAKQREAGEPILPQVVIVIDELADLMMTCAKEVEESICRVAQMGRASGMHLVIATQRPSADVITGLMKANIPSRIAFAVSSAMESRIILDQMGAEKLVGSGDMLYAPLGVGKPVRIQGAFVTDEEREKIVNYVKQYGEAQYNTEIMESMDKAAEEKPSAGRSEPENEAPANAYDEMLPQAVDVIFETKQASVSLLQRRLKLGYSRAARIVDQMEEIGVVGPFEGSKPRQILMTREQWMESRQVQGIAPAERPEQMNFADLQAEEIENGSEEPHDRLPQHTNDAPGDRGSIQPGPCAYR